MNNFAPSASIAWRPERAVRLPAHDPRRSRTGDGSRRVFGGLRSSGPDQVHRPLWRQPRRIDLADAATPTPGLVPAGESWPVLLSQTSRLVSRGLQPGSDLPDRRRREPGRQPQCFAPDIKIARVRTWTVGFAAVDLEGHGGRDPLRRQPRRQRVVVDQLQLRHLQHNGCTRSAARTSSPTGSSTSSSWRWRTSRPTTPRASRPAPDRSPTSAPAPARVRCPSTWPISTAAGTPATRRLIPAPRRRGRTRRSPAAWPRRIRTPTRRPWTSTATLARRTQAHGRRLPGELLRAQSRRGQRQRDRQRRVQQVQRAAARAAAAAVERLLGERQLPVCVRGRVAVRRLQLRPRLDRRPGHGQPTVRHAIKFQADWTLPFGRGQRFGGN